MYIYRDEKIGLCGVRDLRFSVLLFYSVVCVCGDGAIMENGPMALAKAFVLNIFSKSFQVLHVPMTRSVVAK